MAIPHSGRFMTRRSTVQSSLQRRRQMRRVLRRLAHPAPANFPGRFLAIHYSQTSFKLVICATRPEPQPARPPPMPCCNPHPMGISGRIAPQPLFDAPCLPFPAKIQAPHRRSPSPPRPLIDATCGAGAATSLIWRGVHGNGPEMPRIPNERRTPPPTIFDNRAPARNRNTRAPCLPLAPAGKAGMKVQRKVRRSSAASPTG